MWALQTLLIAVKQIGNVSIKERHQFEGTAVAFGHFEQRLQTM